MQSHFFYFHVSNVWFNVALLRELGGFPPEVKWHGDLLAAYAAAFERGAVYTPDAVSYVRVSPTSYGAAGSRSSAQLGVLRAWLELTRRPGWERRRAALVAAAVWPDYRLRAVRALVEIPATSRFDWHGGSFGCRSGPSWHRFSVLAFAAGSVPSGRNIVAGYGTRSEVAVHRVGRASTRRPTPI